MHEFCVSWFTLFSRYINSLVKTTTEAAGVNCTNGGFKTEFGLDANSNGTLEAGEINATLTKYVCNGLAGTNGTNGTSVSFYTPIITTLPSDQNATINDTITTNLLMTTQYHQLIFGIPRGKDGTNGTNGTFINHQ